MCNIIKHNKSFSVWIFLINKIKLKKNIINYDRKNMWYEIGYSTDFVKNFKIVNTK